MKVDTTQDQDRIMEVWRWCQTAYLQQGRKLSFPSGTDPSKTYQWRYVRALADRLYDWGLDDTTSRRLIEVAAAHAREHGLMNKGLSLLCQGNLLELCHARLQQESELGNKVLQSLEDAHQFLLSRCGGDRHATLMGRPNRRAFRNLTRWYQERALTDLYLALSAPCLRALNQIGVEDQLEREQFPSRSRLYLVRTDFAQDAGGFRRAKQILGGDWR